MSAFNLLDAGEVLGKKFFFWFWKLSLINHGFLLQIVHTFYKKKSKNDGEYSQKRSGTITKFEGKKWCGYNIRSIKMCFYELHFFVRCKFLVFLVLLIPIKYSKMFWTCFKWLKKVEISTLKCTRVTQWKTLTQNLDSTIFIAGTFCDIFCIWKWFVPKKTPWYPR